MLCALIKAVDGTLAISSFATNAALERPHEVTANQPGQEGDSGQLVAEQRKQGLEAAK